MAPCRGMNTPRIHPHGKVVVWLVMNIPLIHPHGKVVVWLVMNTPRIHPHGRVVAGVAKPVRLCHRHQSITIAAQVLSMPIPNVEFPVLAVRMQTVYLANLVLPMPKHVLGTSDCLRPKQMQTMRTD